MTARHAIRSLRRGACPGLSAPMHTGDGFLVRLLPIGAIALDAFAGLCAAAQQHGNGIVEITARGSVQVRGLSAASAPVFAAQIAALGIAAQEGVPVLTSPLVGIDAGELFDTSTLAADLRAMLAESLFAARVSPKVSVVIDGGATPNLDDVAADVRLRAELADEQILLRVGVGGDASTAREIGAIAPSHGVEAATRILQVIARYGRDARARDIIASEGIQPFQAAFHAAVRAAELRLPAAARVGPKGLGRTGGRSQNTSNETIGSHRLRDGSFARGVGLAFGHAHATTLEHLMEAATAAGASEVRAAPGRMLIIVGLTRAAADAFAAAADRLGFIVHADDPRRRVIACPGAPLCASGHIVARAIAPQIAASAGASGDAAFTVHVSGCSKSCAHPQPAALTIVGTAEGCALVTDGSVRDAPFAVVANDELPAAVADYARKRNAEPGHV